MSTEVCPSCGAPKRPNRTLIHSYYQCPGASTDLLMNGEAWVATTHGPLHLFEHPRKDRLTEALHLGVVHAQVQDIRNERGDAT